MEENTKNIAVRQATQWYARLRAPDCSDAERAAFKAWFEFCPENASAYSAAVRTAELTSSQNLVLNSRIKALALAALTDSSDNKAALNVRQVNLGQVNLNQVSQGVRVQSFANTSRSSVYSLGQQFYRYAAVVVFAFGLLYIVTTQQYQAPSQDSNVDYYTNNQALQQQFVLSDGSTLFLDVGAKVSVEMTAGERRLELMKGRAYFEVAHDSSRPFTVHAADTEVVALGTRFEVNVEANNIVEVTLAQGSVGVSYREKTRRQDTWRDVLLPGEQLTVDNTSGQRQARVVNADAVTSWSSGLLMFDNTPLHQALDEINRYADIKVHIGDSSLADIAIGGNVVAGSDASEFVRTLTAALPLKSIRTGPNEIVLFPRQKSHFTE